MTNYWITNYWTQISERLHEESALHYPNNEMRNILEVYFNTILSEFEKHNREIVNQGFLVTSTGYFLDLRGAEYGIPRKTGEYAKGQITFVFVNEIPKNQTPTQITTPDSELAITDYSHQLIQDIVNNINTQRKNNNYSTIYEIRKAVSDYSIPIGTKVQNDRGYEYILTENLTIKKDEYLTTGSIKASSSGQRYNTEEQTVTRFNTSQIGEELICINPYPIQGGKDGETDDDYRHRLLNNINTNLSIPFLRRQKIIIYTKKQLNHPIRTKLTSFNPYINNKYSLIPPLNEVEDFVNNELIADYSVVIYKKGW